MAKFISQPLTASTNQIWSCTASKLVQLNRAPILLVMTLLQCPTHLGTAGIQGSYGQIPCLTFSSLLGPKLTMCDLQDVSDQLLKAVELPWGWFGPF